MQTVAISVDAACTTVADLCQRLLVDSGTSVRRYVDGQALEADVRDGVVAAVLELSLADMLSGTAGPERLTACALAGVPQVIAPTTLAGSPRALDALGKDVAHKASASRGPVAIVLPPNCPVEFVQSLRNWLAPNVPIDVASELPMAAVGRVTSYLAR